MAITVIARRQRRKVVRKLIIIAASIAALAIPAAAMASVAVDSTGVGTVGKGDVQNALGLASDAAMQDLFNSTNPKGAAIKFTTSYTKVDDNTLNCMKYVSSPVPSFVPTGDTVHQIYRQTITQDAKATANTNGAGKLTNGWNLTGFDGPISYGPQTNVIEGTCPAGTFIGTTADQDFYNTPRSGLKVNGFDLPNTPVV
jgi:hypothetical protein